MFGVTSSWEEQYARAVEKLRAERDAERQAKEDVARKRHEDATRPPECTAVDLAVMDCFAAYQMRCRPFECNRSSNGLPSTEDVSRVVSRLAFALELHDEDRPEDKDIARWFRRVYGIIAELPERHLPVDGKHFDRLLGIFVKRA